MTKVPVTFIYSGQTLELNKGDYILEAAEEAGIEMISDCRNGSCGTCVTMAEGEVEWATSEHCLSDEQVAEGHILTCVCKIKGPLFLEE